MVSQARQGDRHAGAQIALKLSGRILDAAVREARARGGGETAAVGVTADVTTPAGVAKLVDAALGAYGGSTWWSTKWAARGPRDFAVTDEADPQAVLERNPFPALRVSRAALAPPAPPLLIYARPRGLRQDPRPAAPSPA